MHSSTKTDETLYYQIHVQGHLDSSWEDWFPGASLAPYPDGSMWLKGRLPDQAALLGMLTQLQALNLSLLSVASWKRRDRPAHSKEIHSP